MSQEKIKTEKQLPEGQVSGAENSAIDVREFQKQLTEALSAYINALKDVHNNGVKKSEELFQELIRSEREQQMVADESLKEDYRSFASQMQQIWGNENAQTKAEDAQRNLGQALHDRQNGYQNNLEEVRRRYTDMVSKNLDDTRQDYTNGYLDFLRTVQSAWARADLKTMNSQALAAAGQIMIVASTYAEQTLSGK
jgi:hypothetical protein